MRVIGGALGGRRLRAPKGRGTRPTADRVREALFSSIAQEIPGAHVLDLYAGSGAVGIEALSRGASSVVFVERSAAVAEVLRHNLRALDLEASVIVDDAAEFAARSFQGAPFDVVFADPPYAEPLSEVMSTLDRLARSGALRPGARIVVERDRQGVGAAAGGDRQGPNQRGATIPDWLEFERQRPYGDTVLIYLRAWGHSVGEDKHDRQKGP